MAQSTGKCESAVIVYGDRVITKKRKLSCIDSKFKFILSIHLVLVLYSLMYVLELNLTALQNGLKKTLQQYTRYQKQFSSHPDSQCLWF